MMKIQNEASVNLLLDPVLQIKRYEKEIRDLKQELAMRDTLQNRGRVNYSAYNQKEQEEIHDLTAKFLDGKTDDIGSIDSLRKVREVFNCIRLHYRHTLQNVEAMRRQVD
jgi:kinesin family protein 6/9